MSKHHDILGISPGASEDEIKKAYRKMAMKYHPDRHFDASKKEKDDAEANFKKVTEAYDILTGKTEETIDHDFHPGDIFSGFGGFRGFGKSNITEQLVVPIEVLINGGQVNTRVTIPSIRNNMINMQTVTIPIKIEPETPVGKQIRIDKPEFNLIMVVIPDIRPQNINGNVFSIVSGVNVSTKASIDVLELCSGSELLVETLRGKTIKLNVPAGTRTNNVFSIPNYGLTYMDMDGSIKKGNMLIELDVTVPKLDDKQIASLKKLLNKTPKKK